ASEAERARHGRPSCDGACGRRLSRRALRDGMGWRGLRRAVTRRNLLRALRMARRERHAAPGPSAMIERALSARLRRTEPLRRSPPRLRRLDLTVLGRGRRRESLEQLARGALHILDRATERRRARLL